jgi:hypothetical protein
MAYIGVQPTDTYLSIASQQITGNGGANYTLDYSVSDEESLAVFVNNVRQNVSSYTVSGTSLTLGGTISASDECWVLFLGRTVGTKTPAVGSVTNDMLSGSIATSKLANQNIGFRNLIINGDMSIAQRGTSSTSSDFATVDRNNILFGTISATQSQTTDVPSNYTFNNSFKLNVDTASSATNANANIRQIIEAQMIRSSGWNYTSSSSYLTLSFWVKCSLAGTYYAVFRSEDGTQQSISKSYTINSANTWEKKTITISGNSNITINNDNGRGLTVWFVFIAGTDNSGSSANLDSWGTFVSGNYTPDSSDAQTFLNTTNANISFTGVQLEVGTSASDFEFLPYDVNLQRCQRYYYAHEDNVAMVGRQLSNTECGYNLPFPNIMRTTPTVTYNSPSNDLVQVNGNNQSPTGYDSARSSFGTKSAFLALDYSSNGAGNNVSCKVILSHSATSKKEFDAEL